jgi:mycofactocin system glycosyltransferase
VRLQLDPSTRVLAGGAVVLGGQPARLLRLTPAGASLVCAWREGEDVAGGAAGTRLAARLVSAGLAHPIPDAGEWTTADVAVVIPARDRAGLLAACLARLGPAGEIVVVDDGSADASAIAAVAVEGGARVVRHARPCGPAAARNTGAAASRAPFVAFLDSDTRALDGWLEALLGHLADPAVAAVAPRIAVPAGRGAVSAYEAVRSPLDLGEVPGLVGPGRRIAFVPAAALLVRRHALTAIGGFDPALRVGEDVDLVWRLVREGWAVRYEPSARVHHPHRARPAAWLTQRVAYGSSAGALARRHPGQLHHAVVPARALAPWLVVASGRPGSALLAAAASTAALAARLPDVPGARREMLGLAALAHVRLVRQLLDATWRAYPPVVIGAAVRSRRARHAAVAGLVASVVADWVDRRPALDPVRFAALRTADDLAYAAGLWLGCLRARTLGPLIPRIV